MKRNTLFSILATAALGLVMAAPAYADARTFTWKSNADNTAFRTVSNWDGGILGHQLPVAGDKAIIQSTTNGNDPVISNDETFALLTINNDGVLTVTGANTLTLTGSSHILDGDLVLQDDDSIVRFTASATVAGRGSIKGQNDGAEVQVAAGKVLTSTMSIVGNMKIVGETGPGNAGKLDNRGLVHANVTDGILLLDSNLIVVDTGGAVRWDASGNSGAVLQFGAGIACDDLAGNFNLDGCATLQFDGDVYTSGSFTFGDGFIDIVGGGSFNYDCDAGCSNCTTVDSDTSYGSCG